jgi:hypothetical protein
VAGTSNKGIKAMARDDSFTHPYDDPTLTASDFLFSVMRDPSVPIEDRIDAARFLIFLNRYPYILEQIAHFGEARLKEIFDELPPVEQAELKNVVNGLLRCNVLGIDQPLDWLPVKGHA